MDHSTAQHWLARPPLGAVSWAGLAFCAALGLAAGVLALLGTGEKGLHVALLAIARLMFLFFWLAYAGSALVSLFGSIFQPLKNLAREFGLAFAAVLIVHLSLVAKLCLIGSPPPLATFVIFGIAAAFAYILACFSIPRLQHALGPQYWRLLRIIGMNYIAFVFALDFRKQPLGGGILHIVEYAPFAALAIAGPCLVLAQFARRVLHKGRGGHPS